MKKSLIAVAVLGSFAASAFAAPSVTLYGRIDQGLAFTNYSKDARDLGKHENNFAMESGFSTGNRWGLKGTEDLGNGLKAGFSLESGFTADDGKSAQGGRLFGREALVSLSGSFGTIYAGRFGSIASDMGSLGILGGTSPFFNSLGPTATFKGSTGSAFNRYDNSLGYASPVFSGFKVLAMYSMKADSGATGEENKGSADRYAAAGLQYKSGPAYFALTGEWTQWGNDKYGDLDDGFAVTAGGHYDFSFLTAYAKATYFKNAASYLDTFGAWKKAGTPAIKGWGLEGGLSKKFGNTTVKGAVGYRDAESDVSSSKAEGKRLNAALAVEYPFSKRTKLYGVAGYVKEWTKKANHSGDPAAIQVGGGIVHMF
jgi:predicted porin